MSLARRVAGKSPSLYRRGLGGWHRIGVKVQVWARGWSLVLSGQSLLNVRPSCDGLGTVVVGPGVKLGYRMGSPMGDGGIGLQTRSRQARITVGGHAAFNNNVTAVMNEQVEIGVRCLIAGQVAIYDSDLREIRRVDRDGRFGGVAAVTILDGAWLSSSVTVLKGVTIEANSVIASGAVATTNVPANVIAGGVPAKAIRAVDQVCV